MSGLFGGGDSTNASQSPTYTGIDVNTSVYGQIVQVVYGAQRVSGNLIWYGDFAQISGSGSKGGGKGGGGGGKAGGNSSQNTYQAAVAIALSEGPIAGLGNAWSDKTETTPNAIGFGWLDGAYPQAPWTYLSSNHAGQALGYSGIAYAVDPALQLGSSAQLPNITFEVHGRFYATAPNGVDADPSLVVVDILINPAYGAGFPAGRIGAYSAPAETHAIPPSAPYTVTVDQAAAFNFNLSVEDSAGNLFAAVSDNPGPGQYSFAAGVYNFNAADAGKSVTITYAALGGLSDWQAYCLASGLWVSPAYSSQQQTSSVLDEYATYTNSEWVWSSGALKIVPRGAVQVINNGYTYTPPSAALFDLTDDDYLPNTNASGASAAMTDDPVLLTRQRVSDQLNDITLEAIDRSNQYNSAVVEVSDRALIDRYGRRTSGSQQAHLFADLNAANVSAQLMLQRQYIRNTYQFTLDSRYAALDPMDIVTLSDSSMGIDRLPVRITEITEQDDGTLSISAEEYPAGLGAAAVYDFETGSAGYRADYSSDPGPANPPLIFEPPVEMPAGLEVWLLASGGENWGGAQVWISFDGDTYSLSGIVEPATMGVLAADLPQGGPIDTADVLAVDLTESRGELISFTEADAEALNSLCYVDGELIAYAAATLSAANMYNLSYLVRGAYGTPISAHMEGSQFALLGGAVFKIPYTKDRIGQTFYVKLVSYNIFGGGLQQLSDVEAYPFTIAGPQLPSQVQGFSVKQNGGAVVFTWQPLTDYALKGYDIGYGPQGTTDFSDMALLTEVGSGTEMTNASVPPGTWTFGIVGHDIADQRGPIATYDFIVVNENPTIVQAQQRPNWLGTLDGFLIHYTRTLIPESTKPANMHTNAELFEQFVPYPVATASFKSSAIDTGFDATLRVYSSIAVVPGRGVSGQPETQFLIDSWLTGQADPDVFSPWTIGLLQMRYLRGEVQETPGSVPSMITGFEIDVDQAPVTETGQTVTIASGGTNITFPAQFHEPPFVTVTVIGSTALIATATNVTATGCTIHVFNTAGADVGGNVNWVATGS